MLSFFPRGVLDEILNLIESVSEDFPSYSYLSILILVIPRRLRKMNLYHALPDGGPGSVYLYMKTR